MSIANYQVTVGAATTVCSSTSIPARQVVISNNGGHSIRVGDSTTSSTKGILIATATNYTLGQMDAYTLNLNQLYINGTQNDVIDVVVIS